MTNKDFRTIKAILWFVILMLVGFVLCVQVKADTVLTWQGNTEHDLAGYKVYESVIPGDYLNPLEVIGKVVEYTIPHEMDKCYYYVVTAFDFEGLESDLSNEVSNCDGLKPNPVGLTIIIRDSTVTINTGN